MYKNHTKNISPLSAIINIFAMSVIVAVVFYFLDTKNDTALMTVKINAEKRSIFQVYWSESNRKYTEENSASVRIMAGKKDYTLKIGDLRYIQKLRIDPLNTKSTITITNIVIKQKGYKPYNLQLSHGFDRLNPLQEISRLEYSKNKISVTSSGPDPQLEWVITSGTDGVHKRLKDIIRNITTRMPTPLFIITIFYILVFSIKTYIVWIQSFRTKYLSLAIHTNEDINRLTADSKNGVVVITILFVIIMILLGRQIAQAFSTSNIFGSNEAPYSDALMWLRGTLHYMHGLAFKTYRPTINLFMGSIYSVFGRIYLIPFFSIAFFFINISLIFFFFDNRLKIYLLIFILLIFLVFNELINPLNIGQVMMDFLPFSFTVIGICYIGWALKNSIVTIPFLYIGILLIGMATAVRGVQLIGGFMIVMIAAILIWDRTSRLNILILPLIYLFPLMVDILLQKKYGSINNGIIAIFCFYNDQNHTYNSECKAIYKSINQSNFDITINYFKFLFSPDGLKEFFSNIKETLSDSMDVLRTKEFCGLLISISTIQLFRLRKYWRINILSILKRDRVKEAEKDEAVANIFFLKYVVHLILVPFLLIIFSHHTIEILFAYISYLFFVSLVVGYHYTALFMALYIGGLILFSMMGMPGRGRVMCSFAFALPLSYLLFVIEDSFYIQPENMKNSFPVMVFTLIVVVFLYVGNAILPTGDIFYLKKNTIFKLSDDQALNRSLYYSDDGKIFYTESNNEEIGFKRPYKNIKCKNGGFNASFKTPCLIN